MHRLALALGMTVEDLGGRMGAAELADWAEYEAIEPFGEAAADRRAAVLAQVIAAVNTPKGKQPPDVAAQVLKALGRDVPAPEADEAAADGSGSRLAAWAKARAERDRARAAKAGKAGHGRTGRAADGRDGPRPERPGAGPQPGAR